MDLKQLKEMYTYIPDETILEYGITDVFSWRGSYDEVAFSIGENVSAKVGKDCITRAYNDLFYGYKGGEYTYSDSTPVNFEAGNDHYSDGDFREEVICDMIKEPVQYDRDALLVNMIANPANYL